ncbi:sublancin family glycopeptide [Priestia megaterium]|uniref:sublancin family glycopeptide n=1 Tax=Priestia megaterium TaxID=1404 RepID=UPI00077D7552|nr:sublancin family glycopeptide [Priestia megaterium]
MNKNISKLMEEVSVEEMEQLQGKGLSKTQCAWMAASCVNYLPGVPGGFGCGGYEMCKEYKQYCN